MPRSRLIGPGSGVRLVLDTNTALSGLLWGGTPGRLVDAAEDGRIELASSVGLLAEQLEHGETLPVNISISIPAAA